MFCRQQFTPPAKGQGTMSLRLKALILIITTTVVILGIVFGIAQFFFMSSFQRIEEQYARDMVDRTTSAFNNRLQSLHMVNRDWAAWDDTYAFVQQPIDNEYYVKSNLTDSTYINNKLNFIFIIDNTGQIIYGRGFDLNTGMETEISPKLREHILSRILTYHGDIEDSVAGIIMLPQGPLLVSSQPILTSNNEGPIRGTFIMARYFDSALVNGLSETVHLPLTVVRVDDAGMPPAFEAVRSFLSPETPVFINQENGKSIAGYELLEDVYGVPALMFRIDMPRDIYGQGRATMMYFLLALCAFAVVYGYLVNLIVSRMVIARLERVGNHVNKISVSGNLSKMPLDKSNDELTDLEKNINGMVDKLRDSQEQLNRELNERRQMQQKLEEMATHDFLTGLPNRILLIDRFNVASALAHRNKARLAVMSLDIDRFKVVNDTHGHDTGDKVLTAFGARISGIIRASDTLARVGGDEFILLMLETNHMEDATFIAKKILDSCVEPLSVDDHWVHLTTSIGIAIYPEDAKDLETLSKKSDAALYYAKGHGRNRYKFFSDGDVWITGDRKSRIY